MTASNISSYYDVSDISHVVSEGGHRDLVGGLWDEMGKLQIELLRKEGLQPQHKLIDIGCGSLRGGVQFVRYLAAGNYFGIDINQSLIDAGYTLELDDRDREKLPRENLKTEDDFDFRIFETKFDVAIALSVFTHLPINHIAVCLERLAEVMNPGGRFFASFFEVPENSPRWPDYAHQPGGITTHACSDPFHYRVADFEGTCTSLPWKVHYIGDVNHPRAQKIIAFERT